MTPAIRIFLLLITVVLMSEFGHFNTNTVKKTCWISGESIQILMKLKQIIHKTIVKSENYLECPYLLCLSSDMSLNTTSKQKKSRISDIFNPFKLQIKTVFPVIYLGLFKKTDACYKARDLCSANILVGEERDGLMNNGIFTRSSYECDGAFYQCLKEANNILATKIGKTYLNLLKPQCFQKYYPIERCKKYTRW